MSRISIRVCLQVAVEGLQRARQGLHHTRCRLWLSMGPPGQVAWRKVSRPTGACRLSKGTKLHSVPVAYIQGGGFARSQHNKHRSCTVLDALPLSWRSTVAIKYLAVLHVIAKFM